MIEVVLSGNAILDFRRRWTRVDLPSVDAFDIVAIRFHDEDVLEAWQRYVNVLPWPNGCAFYEPDLRLPGRYKPHVITWFGDDAKFAVANWRM